MCSIITQRNFKNDTIQVFFNDTSQQRWELVDYTRRFINFDVQLCGEGWQEGGDQEDTKLGGDQRGHLGGHLPKVILHLTIVKLRKSYKGSHFK